ncbi:hypothetical protein [Actinopolymorpha pittospori]
MPLFRRSADTETTFVLAGFTTQDAYERRAPDWEPPDTFDSLDAATAAARSWIEATSPQAQVEVMQLGRRAGKVLRVVTADGHDDAASLPI